MRRDLSIRGWKGFHAGRGLVFHFNTEFMKSEVFGGMSAHAALLAIRAAGYLISNGEANRLTNKISVPGVGKRNVYSVLGTLMDAEDFADEA